jgi:hypothetical protein
MSTEAVESVEVELGLNGADTEILKGVRLVWQKLQKMRSQALRDDKHVATYRDLLIRSLTQARAQLPPDDAEAVRAKADQFWRWYGQRCTTLGVYDKEFSRGSSHQAWCERWLTSYWKAFEEALVKTLELPTEQNYERVQTKAEAMLRAYVGIFEQA